MNIKKTLSLASGCHDTLRSQGLGDVKEKKKKLARRKPKKKERTTDTPRVNKRNRRKAGR